MATIMFHHYPQTTSNEMYQSRLLDFGTRKKDRRLKRTDCAGQWAKAMGKAMANKATGNGVVNKFIMVKLEK